MKKTKSIKIISAIGLILIVFVGVGLFFALTDNIQDNVEITIDTVSLATQEEMQRYCSIHCNDYSKMTRLSKDYDDDYFAINCEFTAKYTGDEVALINKAIIKSENFNIIFSDTTYNNISVAPIPLEKDVNCRFSIRMFVKKDSENINLSQEELIDSISSDLQIYLVKACVFGQSVNNI